MASDRLVDGDLLPSSRALAEELSVSRALVVEAYTQLAAAGFVVTVAGSGTRVEKGSAAAARGGAAAAFAPSAEERPQLVARSPAVRFDLRPGFPDLGLLNGRDWIRSWRHAAAAVAGTPSRFAADSQAQLDALRAALSRHLRVSRGITAAAERVLLFNGVGQAIRTITGTINTAGRTLAFEDPGYDKARRAFVHGGADVRPVPVDDSGLRVDRLRDTDWGVYVTPAHQFPMGVRMPATRRQSLLDWAVQSGGYVIEDDYDGEFRYDVAPIPPLQTMHAGADRVIYLGTASKIIARELRIAWAIVPADLHDAVVEQQRLDGEPVSSVSAGALTELIASGALLRHLAASHRSYAARRRRFTDAWHRIFPRAVVHGIDAGLHLVVTFGPDFDDRAATTALADAGVLCAPLSYYAVGRKEWSGLVCGYSQLPETQADAAVTAIRDVLEPSHSWT